MPDSPDRATFGRLTRPDLARSGAEGVGRSARVLVVDNYDSFVYNLVQYLAQLGADVVVVRNDEIAADDLDFYCASHGIDGVLVSPGPGTPQDAGISMAAVRASAASGRPLLGVCLGHQAIGAVFGGTVSRAPELLHGKTSAVEHDGVGVLAGVPSPFAATRYHSLAVAEDTLPGEIEVTARTASGVVMALRHRRLPIQGVQFHPESVLTQGGHLMLANWLRGLGHDVDQAQVDALGASMETLRGQAFSAATA